MKLLHRTALAAALLAVAPLAIAAQDTDTMTVSITIQNSCEITANDLDFGAPTSLANDIDVATSVSLTCTNAGPVSIAFNDGGSGSFATRQMAGPGAATINYGLFRDASHTDVLGDGTGGSVTIEATSTGGSTGQSFPVFGQVFGGQGPKPTGDYTDSIVATVTF